MMQLVLEYAGGRRGVFLTLKAGAWQPVSAAVSGDDGIEATLIPEADVAQIPVPAEMIRFVARSGETVAVEDPGSDRRWSNESHFQSHGIRLLCANRLSSGERSAEYSTWRTI